MSDPTRTLLLEAPGARAARICGILAILSALTCAGIPLAIVLGIVALVKHGKAKRTVAQDPECYLPVTQTGLVTGIVGLALPVILLPVAGIVSAIAIPALLGQRDRARGKLVNAQVLQVASKAAQIAAELPRPVDPDALLDRLLADPDVRALRNPYDPTTPAVSKTADAPPLGGISVTWGPPEEASGGFTVSILGSYRMGGEPREIRKTLEVD
jgi:type II secretory pathway pseudopilin PulG